MDTTKSTEQLNAELAVIKAKQEAEFALSPAGQELQLLKAKQDAEFALTPVGQELQRFQTNQRMGQMYATSTLVPDTYKGNLANCAIAVDVALRMGANALMVMQNLYMVHGFPSWSSKFLIATINTCGRFQPLRYECNDKAGDDYGYRCYTYDINDTDHKERLEGPWVTWAMVKAEGWNKKAGSKWLTMPEQMFRYRAAAFWQRLYAPEISMGFNTVEESQDIVEDVTYEEIPTAQIKAASRKNIADIARHRAHAEFHSGPVADSAAPEAHANDTPVAGEGVDPATGEVIDANAPALPLD